MRVGFLERRKFWLAHRRQLWYIASAFVDLVKPLDSMKGLQVKNTCGLF